MSIAFRTPHPDELDAVVTLAMHSFPRPGRDRAGWTDRFRETPFGAGPEVLWVGEEAGRLVATCQLHQITHYVSGEPFPTMGLGTVAIAPSHRQRGLGGRLVSTALEQARERGDLLSSLYPFRASFYARMGYGLVGETHQYRIPPRDLSASELRKRVEIVTDTAGLDELATFYSRWVRTQTGQLERNRAAWDRLLAGEHQLAVVYRDEDGEVGGYVFASYEIDGAPRDRYLSVNELAWLDADARAGLYGWLASLGDQWHSLALRALPEHRLEDWLREPRLSAAQVPQWGLWFPSAVLLRGPMFRLLDVGEAWRRRKVHPDVELTVTAEVEDELLPGNAGRWRLRLTEGRVEVERGGGGADLEMRLNISALTRLFMGALPATAAAEAGLLVADRGAALELLDKALRLPTSWTFDRF